MRRGRSSTTPSTRAPAASALGGAGYSVRELGPPDTPSALTLRLVPARHQRVFDALYTREVPGLAHGLRRRTEIAGDVVRRGEDRGRQRRRARRPLTRRAAAAGGRHGSGEADLFAEMMGRPGVVDIVGFVAVGGNEALRRREEHVAAAFAVIQEDRGIGASARRYEEATAAGLRRWAAARARLLPLVHVTLSVRVISHERFGGVEEDLGAVSRHPAAGGQPFSFTFRRRPAR